MQTAATTRNHSIDLFRMVCAILAITCHSNLFLDVNESLYIVLSRYMPRFTVTFFLIVSGYYYIRALLEGKAEFLRTFTGILKTYLVWTTIYYIISFVESVLLGGQPVSTFLAQRVVYFFTQGSFYHFWYFPALLYSMLMVTIVHKLFGEKGILVFAVVAIVFYLIGLLGTGYRPLGMQIPLLQNLYSVSGFGTFINIFCVGFSSFSAGYFVFKAKKNSMFSPKASLIWVIALAACYMGEIIYLVYVLRATEKIFVTFFVYPFTISLLLAMLSHPMPGMRRFSPWAKKASAFIYYAHPLVILGLQRVFAYLEMDVSTFVLSAATITIVFVASAIVIKWNNPLTRTLLGIGGKYK